MRNVGGPAVALPITGLTTAAEVVVWTVVVVCTMVVVWTVVAVATVVVVPARGRGEVEVVGGSAVETL
jgi:hypothetical protein